MFIQINKTVDRKTVHQRDFFQLFFTGLIPSKNFCDHNRIVMINDNVTMKLKQSGVQTSDPYK